MSVKFLSDIEVKAGLRDSSGSLGASGQILSSTSGNVSWVTPTINTVARDVQNQVKAGVAITKGQAVYVTGADGTNIIVGLASNTSEATSSKTLGLLNATVAVNGFADVVQIGRLAGLNTIGAVAGDPVWLGTNGNLIYGLINKPYAPAHLVFIGIVTRVNANNGEIFINVQNGFELNEIHDVDLKTTVPINGDVLGFNGTLWVNKTIAQWLGYTPANASGTTNYVSKFTGATTLGNSLLFDNGTNVGIGTTSPIAKLDVNGHINVTSAAINFGGSGSPLSTDPAIYRVGGVNDMAFAIGSTERMRITSAGNVGIGTTSPNKQLTFAQYDDDAIQIRRYTTSQGNPSVGTGISWTWADASTNNETWAAIRVIMPGSGNSNMTFSTTPSGGASGLAERMRITSGGNVGIGTTSPGAKLTVSDTNTVTNQIDLIGYSSTAKGHIGEFAGNLYLSSNYFYNGTQNADDSSLGQAAIVLGAGSTTTSFIDLNLSDAGANNPSSKVRILSNGNVGIGTTSPLQALHIAKPAVSSPSLRLQSTDITTINGTIEWANSSNSVLAFIGSNYNIGDASGNLEFATGGTSTRMVITSSGSVEIKNSDSRLRGGDTSGRLIVSNSDTSAYVSINGSANASPNEIGIITNSQITFNTGASYSERMRISSNGNVGIGTTSPSERLNVGGNISIVPSTGSKIGFNTTDAFSAYSTSVAHYGISYGWNSDPLALSGFYGLGFFTFGSERMRITSSGDVAIGTTAPLLNTGGRGNITINGSYESILVLASGGVWKSYFFNDGVGNTYLASAGALTLSANGNDRMRILSNGNVGIGTTSPSYKTTIYSNSVDTDVLCVSNDQINADSVQHFVGISLQDQYSNGSGNVSAIRSYSNLYSQWGSTLTFSTTGTGGNGILERMRINASGNVGIGTSFISGATKLHVEGGKGLVRTTDSSWGQFAVVNPNDSEVGIVWAAGGAGYPGYDSVYTRQWIAGINPFGTGVDRWSLTNKTLGANTAITVLEAGNVGIGTTTPAAPLSFANLTGNKIDFYYDNVSGGDRYGIEVQSSELRIHSGAQGAASGGITFGKKTATTFTEAMRVANNGNVGIGTTSPTSKLTINGNTHITGGGIPSSGVGIEMQYSGNTSYIGSYDRSLGIYKDIFFYSANTIFENGGLERMRITSNGNVGIGTTSPVDKLEVNGGIRSTGLNGFIRINDGVLSASRADGMYIMQEANAPMIMWTNNSERMRITSSGNVGIGTTSPGNLLNTFIANGAGGFSKGVRISTGNGTYTSGHGGMLEFQNEDVMTAGIRGVRQSGWGSSLLFYVHNTSSGNTFDSTFVERMRINESGNVGINTTAPIHKLSVNGKIGGDVYADSFVQFTATTETIVSADGNVVLGYAQNVVVDNEGSLGVGTIAPEACAAVDITSTTQGFLPPRMTTGERNAIGSPVNGLLIWNTDNRQLEVYAVGTWLGLATV